MKILFCINSIGTRGGIERVTIVKANALAEMKDEHGDYTNKVAIAYSDRFRFPDTIHPLSSLVETFDTEADIWHDWGYKNKWEALIKQRLKVKKYHIRLQEYVDVFRPDIIIGVGQSEKFILPKLKVTWPMVRIREIHFNSTYRHFTYGKGITSRLKAWIGDFIDYKINCRKYDKVFLLTKQDKEENFAKDEHFGWMWNPVSFTIDKVANENQERELLVIASGRLNYLKDFPALLRAWAKLKDRIGDWKLRIVGEGEELEALKKLAQELDINNSTEFPGYSSEMAKEMRKASIFVMTSFFEGLPLVMIEAMSCRLPVVSFDYKFGPRDVIRDGIDGFIAEKRNETLFAEKLFKLMNDEKLRVEMAKKAEQRAEDFDVGKIVKKWMTEYHNLLEQKNKQW